MQQDNCTTAYHKQQWHFSILETDHEVDLHVMEQWSSRRKRHSLVQKALPNPKLKCITETAELKKNTVLMQILIRAKYLLSKMSTEAEQT